jgi:hypothetical protein
MSRATMVVVAVVLATVVTIVALGTRRTPLAFTLGVGVAGPVATLERGDEVCQRPIDVPAGAAFDRIALSVGTFHRAGSPLRVTVRDSAGGVLGTGSVPGGYPDIASEPQHQVRLDRTVQPGRIAVCVRNRGARAVAIYGNVDVAARTSTAIRDGRPSGFDLALVFDRTPRSKLSEIPAVFARASLFRFSWMRGWMYGLLLLALITLGPWLLVRALQSSAAFTEDGDRPQAVEAGDEI